MTVYTYGTPFDAKPIANDTAVAGSTQAIAINDQGVIVGSYLSTSGVLRGFMGSASSVITILADNAATGVTNSQWVVGYYYDSHSIAHGFQILGSIYAQVDEPNATGGTILNGINSSDVLVGTFEDQFGNHGFRRNADLTYTYFDYFPGRTFLQAINDSGLIVGYYGDGNNHTHGLLYNPSGGYIVLDDPSATNATFLNGINNAGQIVGTYNASDGAHSFIYSGGFFTTIPDPVNGHFFASGINNNGQIVGTLYDNTGEHGVVVSPTATPMGQVGLEWSVAGLAADPPSGAAPSLLTQAASAFASSNAVPDASAVLSPVATSAANLSSLAGSADILHQG